MNDHNWRRSRRQLAERAAACAIDHDWMDQPDRVTGRRHCRRCTAYQPGRPDVAMAQLGAGQVREALGWDANKGLVYGRHVVSEKR